jgi:hypothetical protein
LTADWESPRPIRLLTEGAVGKLHPLSELPHPIIVKAAEAFGHEATADNPAGLITASTRLRLAEVKVGQWRGGVWRDDQTGVHWLVVAGLAKGDHADRDDFYQRIARADDTGDPFRWLPTEDDHDLLKQETAARVLTEWELSVQAQATNGLREALRSGATRFAVEAPLASKGLVATVIIEVQPVREAGYEADETVVEVCPHRAFAGTPVAWRAASRVLVTLSPPVEEWDRFGDTYSTISEPGSLAARVRELERLVSEGELAQADPGRHAHVSHLRHFAGTTIPGTALRALCGVFFVPPSGGESLSACPRCEASLARLKNGSRLAHDPGPAPLAPTPVRPA